MAAGMEIRIIEVPSQGNINTTPISTSPEVIKSQIAQDLKNKNNAGSNRFELPSLKAALQNKLEQAFQQKQNQKKSVQKNNTSISVQTSQGSGSDVAVAASGAIDLASMGLGVVGNAALAIFDNATIGASFGKYGGNQVALRKANNVKNTISKVGDIGNSALQGASAGARLGSLAGPTGAAVGAAIGAIAGLAFGISNQALEASKAAKELAMQQAELAAESTKALERMGYNGGR